MPYGWRKDDFVLYFILYVLCCIKKLREMANNSSNPVIFYPPKKWVEHFSKLLNVKNHERNKIEFHTQSLADIKQNSILDSPFTIEEISKGIRETKLIDQNHRSKLIIKTGGRIILFFLVVLFNAILKSSWKLSRKLV